MSQTALFIGVLLMIALCGCIERYYPQEEQLNIGSLVVSAHLNNTPGKQTVKLSRSISIERAVFDPVFGCYVEVERSDGEVRVFEETDPGFYQGDLDEAFLQAGGKYHLEFVSPEGQRYESGYETLFPVPEIEKLYYELESLPTSDPRKTDQGIRFFVDFPIKKDSGRYLRWEMEETFEIHNPDYETVMYGVDRRWYDIYYSMKWLTCWLTRNIYEIHTLDLGNSSGGTYEKQALNYVSGSTWKLLHRYSLLVRQYSHSKEAFWYWSELAKNVQSKGGLFDSQPAITPSNICNVQDEEELVIGYFSISGVSEKRIFVGFVPGLDLYRDPSYCAPMTMPLFLWSYPEDKLPFYAASATINGLNTMGEVRARCVDCRLYKNSTSEKPEFWED